MSHSPISPAILYWGTPVVLITTNNLDGTPNISPMSSAWWLGDRCILGLACDSQTTINLQRTGQCVLNLPSDNMADAVNALARTTGTPVLPEGKKTRGYRYEKDKFNCANLTPQRSEVVDPPRILECPVQMEASLVTEHEMMGDREGSLRRFVMAFEVKVLKTYVLEELRLEGYANRIDSTKWKPMIMMFQDLYGVRGKETESKLAEVHEELYRVPKEGEAGAL